MSTERKHTLQTNDGTQKSLDTLRESLQGGNSDAGIPPSIPHDAVMSELPPPLPAVTATEEE